MRWSGILIAVLSLVVLPEADSQSRRTKTRKTPDLQTFMCKRGDLLFEDALTEETWEKNWRVYKGDYKFDGGNLKVAEIASDGHHPAASRKLDATNSIIQFSFRIDGAKWLGFAVDRKGDHVARAMVRPDSFRVQMATGIGPTTKGYPVDEQKLKFEPGRWYTMLIEFHGNEMLAQVDNTYIAFGGMKNLDREKTQIQLISGGKWAWFKDVRIWKALPDKRWPAKRAFLAKKFKRKRSFE